MLGIASSTFGLLATAKGTAFLDPFGMTKKTEKDKSATDALLSFGTA